MNNLEKTSENTRSQGPLLDKDPGFYASATVTKNPEEAYRFCQNESNVQKVLNEMPTSVENFLDLKLVSNTQEGLNQYRVVWENKESSKVTGKIIFLISQAPANRGSYISCEAQFEKLDFKEDGPSTLVNIFLRSMKMLIETGEIATIKGQPSGREELKTLH